jgi:hypothetical protein
MRRYGYFLMVLCIGLVGIPVQSFAVDSLAANTAFQFIDDPMIPRLVGMGYAGTAFDNGGFSFVNPAQPYLSKNHSVAIGYAPLPGDLSTPFFEGVYNFPDFYVGLHGSNHSISGIVPATELGPNPQNDFSYSFSLVSVDGGYKWDKASLALTLSGMQERIETSTRYGYSVSAGGLYRVVPGKVTLGLAFLNQGKTTAFAYNVDETGQIENLPRSGRLGFAYTDTLGKIPLNAACDVVYRDVGYLGRSAKNISTRLTVPLGVEIWPTSYVAVRVGKRFNFETEVINFGAGLRYNPLTFDMAFVISQLQGDVEVKPMFSLTYAIASR